MKFECLFYFVVLCYMGYKDDNEDKNCLKNVLEVVFFWKLKFVVRKWEVFYLKLIFNINLIF